MRHRTVAAGVLYLLTAFFLATSASATIGSDTAWTRVYDGPAGGKEYVTDLEIDTAGNVYVTGTSPTPDSGLDWATLKYDKDGNMIWERRYNGPGNDNDSVFALWVDDAGNAYVTGSSTGAGTALDYTTIKYDPSGTVLWERRYDGPAHVDDRAYSIFVDAADNVYVTGHSYGLGSGPDYATIKYDASGTELWVKRHNTFGNFSDSARAVVVDAAGNVYVTGTSKGISANFDWLTIKYNAAGTEQWERFYNGTGNVSDIPFAMTLDDAANLYITGTSWSDTTRFDYLTIKYDTDGNMLWDRLYDGAYFDDFARAIVVDDAGNVYITGGSDGPAPYKDDIATIKYDASGTPLWIHRYDGWYSADNAIGYDLHVNAAGDVYVAGFSDSLLADFTCLIYDAAGNLPFTRRFNRTLYTDDRAYAMAVDEDGYIYLGGVTDYVGASDFQTVKLKPCSCPFQADADLDSFTTPVDLARMIDILYGPWPDIREQGCPSPRFDWDCDGFTTPLDASGMIDYLFASGPGPCQPCAP